MVGRNVEEISTEGTPLMDALFWILIILTVLTLVGHGIWVLLAAVFRAIAGLSVDTTARPIPAEMCPRCGNTWERRGDRRGCSLCGWPAENAARPTRLTTETILSHLERRLDRYGQLGLLATEIRDRLVTAIRSDMPPTLPRPRLAEPTPVASPTPEPEPKPEPEPLLIDMSM